MSYNLKIQRILLELEKLTDLNDRILLLKQAINTADANNDLDWGFELRMHIIQNEQYTTYSREAIPAFTWILNVWDTNPDFFSDNDITSILMEYQWMTFEVYRSAAISYDQVMLVIEDFGRRLKVNGYSQRAYYSALVAWFLFSGDMEQARNYTNLRDAMEKDLLSFESELIGSVCIELVDGNFDKAITMAYEQIVAKSPHQISPVHMLCTLVYYLAKAGDDRAGVYFEKLEDELEKNPIPYPYFVNTVALMMYYMSKTDTEKAWHYFEKYAEWEVGGKDLLSFEYSLNVLPLLSQGGTRTLHMSSKMPYYRSDNTYDVSELYDCYYAKVVNLVQRFDERNRNVHFKEQMDEVMALIPPK